MQKQEQPVKEEYPLKYHIRTWASFALYEREKVNKKYGEMIHYLTKEELQEMLSYLAGYIGSSDKGQEILERLFKE